MERTLPNASGHQTLYVCMKYLIEIVTISIQNLNKNITYSVFGSLHVE